MTDARLNALSPLDGRYADKCADLAALFSEAALIARRVRVEAAWFRQLADSGRFAALSRPSAAVKATDPLASVKTPTRLGARAGSLMSDAASLPAMLAPSRSQNSP